MSLEPKLVTFDYLDQSAGDNAWISPRIIDLKDDDLKDDSLAKRVCIHSYGDMEWLGDCEAILDERSIIHIVFDYPLTNPATLTMHVNGGITVKAFVRAVASMYRSVYADEARSTRVKEGTVPGLLNRNRTDGKYGIWGHGINDLYLEGAERKADGRWHLLMGS